MALSGALNRRIGKLESLPRAYSIEDKWSSTHAAALRSLSEKDQNEVTALPICGGSGQCSIETEGAIDRFNEAFLDLFADSRRFTVAELDALLATS